MPTDYDPTSNTVGLKFNQLYLFILQNYYLYVEPVNVYTVSRIGAKCLPHSHMSLIRILNDALYSVSHTVSDL